MTLNRSNDSDHVNALTSFGVIHIFFYVLLSLGMGVGLLAIHIFVASLKERVILEGVFVGISVILAASQLVLQYSIFSRVWSPLKQFIKDLRHHCDVLEDENDQNRITMLEYSGAHSARFAAELNKKHPQEVKELARIFLRQMQFIEKYAKQSEAESSLIVLGKVCAQVAHDIRAPLMTLSSFLEHCSGEKMDEDTFAFREAAKRSCVRLQQMAEELLDDKRAATIERQPIDLAELLKMICDELRSVATDKHVAIHYSGPNSLSYDGDRDKLLRVLQNIMSNGIQAMEPIGGGNLIVKLDDSDGAIAIDISDTGTGIAEEYLGKVFHPSFTTKGKEGTGLGLAYCQHVVTGHGGHIEAMNNPDSGARFRITLPYHVIH